MEQRTSQLQDLNTFISGAESTIGQLIERLGWSTSRHDSQQVEMACCPINTGHRVPSNVLQRHIESCRWKSEGYHADDLPLPDACDSVHSIKIDGKLANTIIQDAVGKDPRFNTGYLRSVDRPAPQTADRIASDFTTDERRALYDYVISKSEAEPVKLEELNFLFRTEKKEDEQPKSLLEVLAAERDAKRRRISHRSKKVSTNRKSHLEVMREVIQNQMELYEEWLNKDTNPEDKIIDKGEDTVATFEPHLDKGNRFEGEQDNRSLVLSSRMTRTPTVSSRRESRETSRSHKYERYDSGAIRDRSNERVHRRSDHYSTFDKYTEHRDERSKRPSQGQDYHGSRSKDRHRVRREDEGRNIRDNKDRKRSSIDQHKREEINDFERGKRSGREEINDFERGKRSGRDERNTELEYRISQPTDRNDSGRAREVINPYYSELGEIGVCVETNGYNPHQVIKAEKMDEGNIPLYDEEARVHESKMEKIDSTTVVKLEDRINEWSEDSQKSSSSSKKQEKRKRKKEKKSKHKRKKHSKHRKHSKRTVSTDSDDFSC